MSDLFEEDASKGKVGFSCNALLMASLQAHVAAFQVRRRVKRNLGGRADVMTMRAVFNGARRPEPRGVS